MCIRDSGKTMKNAMAKQGYGKTMKNTTRSQTKRANEKPTTSHTTEDMNQSTPVDYVENTLIIIGMSCTNGADNKKTLLLINTDG